MDKWTVIFGLLLLANGIFSGPLLSQLDVKDVVHRINSTTREAKRLVPARLSYTLGHFSVLPEKQARANEVSPYRPTTILFYSNKQ